MIRQNPFTILAKKYGRLWCNELNSIYKTKKSYGAQIVVPVKEIEQKKKESFWKKGSENKQVIVGKRKLNYQEVMAYIDGNHYVWEENPENAVFSSELTDLESVNE